MLKQAVSHYHSLLEDQDLAEASRRMLDEGLERARLIFGGRRLSPYLGRTLSARKTLPGFLQDLRDGLVAIQKVKDAASKMIQSLRILV